MLVRITFALLTLAFANTAFAQRHVADSLEHLLTTVPSDTNRVWLLNNIVEALREKDNTRALTYAVQAKELAELLNDKRGLARSLENYAWLLYRQGDYTKSLEESAKARALSEALNDKQGIAKSMINIAAINYEQKHYEPAVENFEQALRFSTQINDTVTMARCLNNIAYSYFALNQLDSAKHHADVAITLGERIKNTYMIAFAYRTLGDVWAARRVYDKAHEAFVHCYQLAVKSGNNFLRSSVLHRLADAAVKEKKFQEAINYLNENIAVASQFGFKDELERAYFLISKVYFSLNDIQQAYRFQSMYVTLHDSLYNRRSSEQMALMQSKYDNQLKQAQIEILTKDAALKAEDIKQQKFLTYFFAGCLALVFILAAVFYQNNRHNRKARISLQEKNREIQTQTRQLKNLNTTKDKLFSIISHDLRSPVASLKALMEIVNTTGLSQEEFVEITKVLKRNLDTVYDDLDNLLFWAQTQLRGLQVVPEPLNLLKIATEKIDFFAEQLANKNIRVINNIPEDANVIADRNHLSLVFRNLLANAIKFNRDNGSIILDAAVKEGFYEVSVTDSGVGMQPEELVKLFNAETHFTKPGTRQEKGVGIGLLLTKEFVEKNNGSIRVSSEPGKGATFIFTVKATEPVEAHALAV
jgi:two-component system, sensor histidine kinase and response regulator